MIIWNGINKDIYFIFLPFSHIRVPLSEAYKNSTKYNNIASKDISTFLGHFRSNISVETSLKNMQSCMNLSKTFPLIIMLNTLISFGFFITKWSLIIYMRYWVYRDQHVTVNIKIKLYRKCFHERRLDNGKVCNAFSKKRQGITLDPFLFKTRLF